MRACWDTRCGYGWISIALHWLTAAVVVTLWYTGSLSQLAEDPERYVELVGRHMTVALTTYVLLWARVVWRLAAGHPGPRPGQHGTLLRLGKYLLVLAIAAMLVSGPLMVWAGGAPLRFFQLEIPSPFGGSYPVHHFLRQVHHFAGTAILLGTSLHVLAVICHVAVMRDGSFDRIMIAHRETTEAAPPRKAPTGHGQATEG